MKKNNPSPSPVLLKDVALMDTFIRDICQSGGQHSPGMDAWCKSHKRLWKRLRAKLVPRRTK